MAKRVSKKRNIVFAARLRAVISEFGGVEKSGCLGPEFYLTTLAGPLRLAVYENTSYPGAWVAGRFADVEAAKKQVTDVNPYSGKWNHHFFTENVEEAGRTLRTALRRLTTKDTEVSP